MKVYYIIFISFISTFAQMNDTLVFINAMNPDIIYNDFTKNYEIVYVEDSQVSQPYLVSIDSNNQIIDVPKQISTMGGANWPAIDVRNGTIATIWQYCDWSFNDLIRSSVLNDSREILYGSHQINFKVWDYLRNFPDIAFLNDSLLFAVWAEGHMSINEVHGKVLNITEEWEHWECFDTVVVVYPDGSQINRLKLSINDVSEYVPITWDVKTDSNTYGIYCRIYDKNIRPKSDVFTLKIDTLKFWNYGLSILDSAHFLISYVKYTNTEADEADIYLEKYTFNGERVASIKVNDYLITSGYLVSSMAVNSAGNVIVFWDPKDHILDKRYIVAQRFEPNLNKIGNNFIAVSVQSERSSHRPNAILKDKQVVLLYSKSYSKITQSNDFVVKMYDFDNPVSIAESKPSKPDNYILQQNYPNPFNPKTFIEYDVKQPGNLTLKVFDITGRLVKTLEDSYKQIGNYKTEFDGSVLASGVYIYQLSINGYKFQSKMLLIK